MCAIAGILDRGGLGRTDPGELAAMVSQLRHRGPDGTGFYRDDWVGLGHARLSIIDLATGDQPIHNEDRTIQVVFNGEIFNYRELRTRLQAEGHQFYTASDTEVIVHLYESHGVDFVQQLNGQFAIALWDSRQQRLLLVRDRVGILPLFYSVQGQRLRFASEVKALLALPDVDARLDPTALDQLFTFWAPVSPRTVFAGVYEVPPGCLLEVQRGDIHERRYWDWQFPTEGGHPPRDPAAAAEELLGLLADATRIRLRADVPVGAYLSGGLDSSSLVALMARQGHPDLNTFSIGFADQALDERTYQQALLDRVATSHHAVHCGTGAVAEWLPLAIRHAETPVLRTAPVPMAMLSARVRAQGMRVVLTGEGADEVLGGYDLFKEDKIRRFWATRPDSRLRPLLLKRLYPYLDITKGQTLVYLQRFFGRDLDRTDSPFYAHLPRWTTTALCKTFFSAELAAQLRASALSAMETLLPPDFGRWHPFNRAQYVEAKSLMSGYLLSAQGDRMLMAHSVEGRFPFLDHRVLEFAAALHPRLKMRALDEKYLLKRAMRDLVPEVIRRRSKQPYRAPNIPAFFQPGAPAYVEELLTEGCLRRYGYFDPAKVALLLRKIRGGHAIGAKDNMALVGILSTQLWHWQFVENRAAFQATARNQAA